MKLTLPISFLSALILAVLWMSCAGPEKLMDQGRYEEALELLMHKLDHGKISGEKVVWLQEAYDREEARWKNRFQLLLSRPAESQQLDNALRDAEALIEREQDLTYLRRRINSAGFNLQVTPVDTMVRIHDQLFDLLLHAYAAETEPLVERAENGDKWAAREAFALYQQWNKWEPANTTVSNALEVTRDLGTEHILFLAVDQRQEAWPAMPFNLTPQPEAFSLSEWQIMHFQDDRQPVDYVLYFDIRDWHLGPERVTEQLRREQQRVIDGYRVRRDTLGNMVKDSLGQPVKDPVWTTAHAEVIRVTKSKESALLGSLELRDERTGQIVWQQPVELYDHFINEFVRIHGDQRAVKGYQKDLSRQSELPFPEARTIEDHLWSMLMGQISDVMQKRQSLMRPNA